MIQNFTFFFFKFRYTCGLFKSLYPTTVANFNQTWNTLVLGKDQILSLFK